MGHDDPPGPAPGVSPHRAASSVDRQTPLSARSRARRTLAALAVWVVLTLTVAYVFLDGRRADLEDTEAVVQVGDHLPGGDGRRGAVGTARDNRDRALPKQPRWSSATRNSKAAAAASAAVSPQSPANRDHQDEGLALDAAVSSSAGRALRRALTGVDSLHASADDTREHRGTAAPDEAYLRPGDGTPATPARQVALRRTALAILRSVMATAHHRAPEPRGAVSVPLPADAARLGFTALDPVAEPVQVEGQGDVSCPPKDPYGVTDVFRNGPGDKLHFAKHGAQKAVARAYLVQCVDAGAAEAAGRHGAVLWPVWRVSAAVSQGGRDSDDAEALAHAAFGAPCRLAGGASAADCTVRSVVVKLLSTTTEARFALALNVSQALDDTPYWQSPNVGWQSSLLTVARELFVSLLTAHSGFTPHAVAAGFVDADADADADAGADTSTRHLDGAACASRALRGHRDAVTPFSVVLLDGCRNLGSFDSGGFFTSLSPANVASALADAYKDRHRIGARAFGTTPRKRVQWWHDHLTSAACVAEAWPPVRVPAFLSAAKHSRDDAATVLVYSLARQLALISDALCGLGAMYIDDHSGNYVVGGRSGCHVTLVDVDSVSLSAWGSGDPTAAALWARLTHGIGGGSGNGTAAGKGRATDHGAALSESAPPSSSTLEFGAGTVAAEELQQREAASGLDIGDGRRVPADPTPNLHVASTPTSTVRVMHGTLGCVAHRPGAAQASVDTCPAGVGVGVGAGSVLRPCASSAQCPVLKGMDDALRSGAPQWHFDLQGGYGVCVTPDPGSSKPSRWPPLPAPLQPPPHTSRGRGTVAAPCRRLECARLVAAPRDRLRWAHT